MPEVLTQEKESDLDKRIALALGLKPTITWAIFNADETALMIDFERQAEARKWWDEHPSVHAAHHIGDLEHYEPYSTNIEASMRIVERFIDMGGRVSMRGMRLVADGMADEYKPGRRVNFYRFQRKCPPGTRFSFDTESESLPEAICRAALAALEVNQ